MLILLIAYWLVLSIVVAANGDSRAIGFWMALLASILLSPLVGFMVVLLSERNSEIEHRQKVEELVNSLRKPEIN